LLMMEELSVCSKRKVICRHRQNNSNLKVIAKQIKTTIERVQFLTLKYFTQAWS
jgi:hypothetical protein